jgi:hypothetical protein
MVLAGLGVVFALQGGWCSVEQLQKLLAVASLASCVLKCVRVSAPECGYEYVGSCNSHDKRELFLCNNPNQLLLDNRMYTLLNAGMQNILVLARCVGPAPPHPCPLVANHKTTTTNNKRRI